MASHIERRKFLATLLSGAAAAWPLAARAQQPAMPVIGFLNSGSAPEWAHLVAAFKEGLNELGYVESRNVAVEYRWAQGENDRLPGLAADLVRRQVTVIAALGPPAAAAAKAATTSIPIIFIVGSDPIDLGLVTSFRRPTSNLTGVNIFVTELSPKRQELLREIVPSAPLVAMLVNPTSAQTQSELREVQAAADRLGQQVRIFNVGSDRELDAAFATIIDQRIGGLLVQTDNFFTGRRDQLVLLTTRHAIPAVVDAELTIGSAHRISMADSMTLRDCTPRHGSENCGYTSFDQCRATIGAESGWCRPNPFSATPYGTGYTWSGPKR